MNKMLLISLLVFKVPQFSSLFSSGQRKKTVACCSKWGLLVTSNFLVLKPLLLLKRSERLGLNARGRQQEKEAKNYKKVKIGL